MVKKVVHSILGVVLTMWFLAISYWGIFLCPVVVQAWMWWIANIAAMVILCVSISIALEKF